MNIQAHKGDEMFKILLALLLMTTPAWSAQWRAGTGEQTLLGSSQASLIGTNSFSSIVSPLDSLLATYCNEYLVYGSSSTLKVSAGSVMVSNSQGTIRLMLQDTGVTTLTSANIDTGSITANTTYYVYSTAATNAATASTYFISASNTAPSGQTYYYQIGNFTTDASNNIANIVNNYGSTFYVGTPSSKTVGTTYQALTDGFVSANVSAGSGAAGYIMGYTDSSSSPSTQYGQASANTPGSGQADHTSPYGSFQMFVQKGNYYKVVAGTVSGASGASSSMTFTPMSK